MKQISTPAIRLFIICFVCTLALGLCSEITKEPIAAQAVKTQTEAMSAVFPDAVFEEATLDSETPGVTKVNLGKDSDGNLKGFVVNVDTNGFGGTISMMVGIDTEGTITGLRILSLSETPGLGAKATDSSFYEQFTGMSGDLAVTKDGGDVQAITSATITSRAVTSGANAALKWFEENGGAY
ncbi:MAG: RnfABCDGE type electron transport complex subunit G [Lachnospiraceae bacterium]|nr:RnfABCDGE type electron transport complex subunit G [Lachnospiraceae bacterium]